MATQVSLTDGAVASAGALAIQTNGTTQAVSISTGQVATLAQNPILTSGTANGVAYLNGSKAVTSGSALVFDGTNLGLGVTPSAWNTFSSVLQVPGGAIAGIDASQVGLWQNAYYNSGYKYKSTAAATFYQQSGASHIWYNAPSGTAGNAITFTQAMTLDASGNLGVGTTSPTYKITVKGGNANNLLVDNDGSQYTQLLMQRNSTANTGGDLLVDGTNGLMSLRMLAVGSLRFCTSASAGDGTERARITSGGDLLVGLTTVASGSSNTIYKNSDSTWVFRVEAGATSLPNGILVKYSGTSPNSTGSQFLYCEDSGNTQRMSVRSNGGIANYSGNNVNLSDRREKINFAPAGSYLDKICAIPVQTFNYIDQNLEEDDGLTLGVVAQDVQAVAPELVMESNWAGKDEEPKMRLSIYQTDLQYALMKCIQEQQALIQTLTDRITALENK